MSKCPSVIDYVKDLQQVERIDTHLNALKPTILTETSCSNAASSSKPGKISTSLRLYRINKNMQFINQIWLDCTKSQFLNLQNYHKIF